MKRYEHQEAFVLSYTFEPFSGFEHPTEGRITTSTAELSLACLIAHCLERVGYKPVTIDLYSEMLWYEWQTTPSAAAKITVKIGGMRNVIEDDVKEFRRRKNDTNPGR